MPTLHLDFETRSTIVDLDKTGVYIYARHPDTDIWCACYAIDDGPIQTWRPEDPVPGDLLSALADPDVTLAGHNVGFEWHIIEYITAPRYGWPRVDPERLDCTAVRSAVQSLPRNLGGAAQALGLPAEKDDAGRRLMLQMMKPRKPRKNEDPHALLWWDDEDRRQRLEAYCRQDVEVERALDRVLEPLSARERKLWMLDFKINQRGVHVDLELVECMDDVLQAALKSYDAELSALTDYAVTATTDINALRAWVGEQMGEELESLDKNAIRDLLARETPLPAEVRRALEIRSEAGKASTAKLRAFQRRTAEDGRMRENLLHHGAGTGRWAGRGVQLQNMPRPKLSKEAIEHIVSIAKDQSMPARTRAELIEWVYGPVPTVLSSCLRACVCAAPGKKFLVADYANIEGRVNAWAAGQEDKIALFAADGPIYERMAAEIYQIPAESVAKGSEQRHLGKTAELGCGYQMGASKFQSTCEDAGIRSVDADMAKHTVDTYRRVNDKIVKQWYGLEEAALQAMRAPGSVASFRYVQFHLTPDQTFLVMILPGGRRLYYPTPRLREKTTPWGAVREQVTYMGTDQITRQWVRQDTYGGKLTENAVQAIARDILASAMYHVEDAGMDIVLTVHDEIVVEVDEDSGWELADLERIMEQPPKFAEGCPIAVEGYSGQRFSK